MKLQGKVALITGGGGGMGGAQARLFAREGAAVCAADLFLDKAEQVADEVRAAGGRAIATRLDVQSSAEWAAAVAATEAAFGPISILCNNAGANVRVGFDEQTEDMWNLIVGTILTGSFLGTKAVIPSMRRGRRRRHREPGLARLDPIGRQQPGYGSAKMGLIGLTRATAASYAGDRIRCVLISPGHVDTPFIRANNAPYSPNDASTSVDNPQNYQRRLASVPLGRLQTPEDIAKAFLFFIVSDDAEMVTGSMLTVDGGAGI